MQDAHDLILRVLIMLPIFLFSLSVHEAAHAITAKWGGDLTSAYLGRVTLNPVPHIDPIGTIIVPIFGIMSGFPIIGWAKPVPVAETNFHRGDGYGVIVALAGPFSNLLIALFTVVFAQIYLVLAVLLEMRGIGLLANYTDPVFTAVQYMILINVVLMVFNMIPIPPLDGSHVLWHGFVKQRPEWHQLFFTVRQFGFIILLGLLWIGVVGAIFRTVGWPLIGFLTGLINLPLYFL